MRRTVGLLAAMSSIIAMTGIAFAAGDKPVVRIGEPRPTIAQVAELKAEAGGVETVGETSALGATLGYLTGAQRSITVRYPGASYVKVHFSQLLTLPGDYVTISNPKRTESYTYRRLGSAWGMSIDGDTAIVTLHRSGLLGGLTSALGVTIDKVAHGFTDAERARAHDADMARRDAALKAITEASGGDPRPESVCGTDQSRDAVCYKSSDPVVYNRSKAVARLLVDGTELCSAWRVGPTDRLFTAAHCFTTSKQAYNTEVWFNYECAVCGGFATLPPTKVWGDKVLATDKTLDYTLFTVANFKSVTKFGYLTLDTSGAKANQEIYIPQHPDGDPTEIAIGSDQDRGRNCVISDPRADGYAANTDVAYLCDTAGGSSGSPVLSRANNKVIALHHFGGCPNTGVRIDLIYAQVKKYLS